MKKHLHRLFVRNWQRKVVALFFAVIIWFLVDKSIMLTKTFVNVPVKVINLPEDKTIDGLLPDGMLSRRLTLTLKGSKSILDELQSKDLGVVINAEGKGDEWIVHVTKKDLVCSDSEVDLSRSISDVSHNELFIKLEKLVTEKIPIKVKMPVGEPPPGYQFLDIWPETLTITVSGPEAQIRELQAKGIDWVVNLADINKEELDHLESLHPKGKDKGDEIIYYIPDKWKKVGIPFLGNTLMPIDDPAIRYLQIDFLRSNLLPIGQLLPISVFFPLRGGDAINPDNYTLVMDGLIQNRNGIKLLNMPLYVRNVSRLFLSMVADNLEIVVVASPRGEARLLPWSIQIINANALEDKYVSSLMVQKVDEDTAEEVQPRWSEKYLRDRFRNYLRQFMLYDSDGDELDLEIKLHNHTIKVNDVTGD